MDDTFEAAARLVAVDTKMTGRYRVTSAYLVKASEPALIETGPTTSADAVTAALERIGLTGAVLGASALTARLLYDQGGFGLAAPAGERQVRDFRVKGDPKLQLAIAKSSQSPEELVRRVNGVTPVETLPPVPRRC